MTPIVPSFKITGKIVRKLCRTIEKLTFGTIGNCFDSIKFVFL